MPALCISKFSTTARQHPNQCIAPTIQLVHNNLLHCINRGSLPIPGEAARLTVLFVAK